MLRVLAVDDEPPALEDLVHLLREDPRISRVDGVTDATKALRFVHHALDTQEPLDALFLDLRMPGLNGLDLARVLTRFAEPPAIVFVTAYDNHAVEAFELNAVDYLLKPARPERVSAAIDKIVRGIQTAGTGDPTEQRPPDVATAAGEVELADGDDAIPVELGGVVRFVRLADVHYAEAHGDYTRLYTPAGGYLIRTPISALEKRWTPVGFVRIHRSHLVAMRHVEEVRLNGGAMTVQVSGQQLSVSRRHASHVRDLLVRNARRRTAQVEGVR